MLRANKLSLIVGLVVVICIGTEVRSAMAGESWQEKQINALRKSLTPTKTLGNPLRKLPPELLWYSILLREQTGTKISVRYEKVQGVDAAVQTIWIFMTEPAAGLRGFYVQCFLTDAQAEFCLNIHRSDAIALGAQFRTLPISPGESP